MQALNDVEVALAISASSNTAARDALVNEMRSLGATAARFTPSELEAFGIVRGSKYILKGSKNGSIKRVLTESDGNVLVILN